MGCWLYEIGLPSRFDQLILTLSTFIMFVNFPPAFKEVFDLFDSNGGGTIDAEELDLALKSVDVNLAQEELVEVVGAMDKDGSKPFPNAIKMIFTLPYK